MKLNSKEYFKNFLKSYLTMDNAQIIYEMFCVLESGEEILFRNCCKNLGIGRDKFLENYRGLEEMKYAEDDTCTGFTQIAVAEKYGKIEYEYPDEPSYGTIKELILDIDNPEFIEFNKKLFHSAVCDIVDSFKESDYSDSQILGVVERIDVFCSGKD